jgi:hypothetical protein
LLVSTAMATAVSWEDIALRLGLTLLTAGAIGFNRDERGHSSGLRTRPNETSLPAVIQDFAKQPQVRRLDLTR